MSLTLVGITGIIVLLLILFFLGVPVGFAMGIVGFFGFCHVVSYKAGLNMVSSTLWDTFSRYGLTSAISESIPNWSRLFRRAVRNSQNLLI